MDDPTTTAEVVETPGADQAQPETTTPEPAEGSTEETQTDPTGTDETVDATADTDEDVEWLKAKGMDPDDPAFKSKVAKAYREAEKDMHTRKQDAKSQLKDEAVATVDTDDYEDPRDAKLRQIETRMAVNDFYAEHPDAKELDSELAEVVKARPYLAQDLEAAYALVKAGKSEASIKEAEKKGRDAAKAEIARAGAAAMPKGNASGTAPTETQDPGLAAFNKTYDQYDR